MSAKPIAGHPFTIPDDWSVFPCGECPNQDCLGGNLMAEEFIEDEDRPEEASTWWRDETPCVCDECGFLGMISADGDVWLQEPYGPLEFVLLDHRQGAKP